MNQTKKITQGAMILAIVGAIMVLDRQIAHYFDEMLFLAFAIVIILYASLYTLKDAGMIAFGIVALTLMFGSIFSYAYCPLGIIVGFGYAYGIKKDWDHSRLLLFASLLMIIGEAVLMMFVLPAIGIPFLTGIEAMQEMMNSLLAQSGLTGVFSSDVIHNLIIIIYVFDVVLIGFMEALLIHMLSYFLLKRFRIKEVKKISLYDIKIKPLVAYLAILPLIGLSFFPYNPEAPYLFYLFTCLSLVGGIILLALGYIFMLIYGTIVLKKNISLYLILGFFLFIPYSLIIFIVIGFLYGSGPLRRYIDKKVALYRK